MHLWVRMALCLVGCTAGDGTLVREPGAPWPVTTNGSDGAGAFTSDAYAWCAGSNALLLTQQREVNQGGCPQGTHRVIFTFKRYSAALAWEVSYPNGASGTNPLRAAHGQRNEGASVPPARASARFPSFSFAQDSLPAGLRYLTWRGNADWAFGAASEYLPSGVDAGPVALLSGESPATLTGGPSVMVSPSSQFLTAQQDVTNGYWSHGPGGELEELPAGFAQETVLVASLGGANAAIEAWGANLRGLHAVDRVVNADMSVSKLGAWTDNGAWMYFFEWSHVPAGLPQALLTNWSRALASSGIPVQYLQLDAWWYASDGWNACIQDFEPHPLYFSQQLGNLSSSIGLPFHLYDNYICPTNAYRGVPFVRTNSTTEAYLLPGPGRSASFELYSRMFKQGRQQAMVAFEIDYLSTTSDVMDLFRRHATAAADWLGGMNDAALANDNGPVPIQFCMGTPRFIMASLPLAAVTNARASTDFKYDERNLVGFGNRAALHWAMRLHPSKDKWVDACLLAVLVVGCNSDTPCSAATVFGRLVRSNLHAAVSPRNPTRTPCCTPS